MNAHLVVRFHEYAVLGAEVRRRKANPLLSLRIAADDHHAIGVTIFHELLGAPPGIDVIAAIEFRLGTDGRDDISTGADDFLVLAVDEGREIQGHEPDLLRGGGLTEKCQGDRTPAKTGHDETHERIQSHLVLPKGKG